MAGLSCDCREMRGCLREGPRPCLLEIWEGIVSIGQQHVSSGIAGLDPRSMA
jgi:hypothetical protein